MKICILGAGLSGSCLAYLLKKKGHEITIYEKQSTVGGLCQERVFSNGVRYHPYGPHIFHTNKQEVIDFLKEINIKIRECKPRVKSYVQGKLVDYPINLETTLPELGIMKEDIVPKTKDVYDNFEEQVKGLMGETLYDLFIKEYSEKQWGTNPKNLSTRFAPKRIYLNKSKDDTLFSDSLQGYLNFNNLFIKLLEGVIVRNSCSIGLHTDFFKLKQDYDLIISTISIDLLFEQEQIRTGIFMPKLKYREMTWFHVPTEHTIYNKFMCVNYPTKEIPFTRIAEIKHLTGQQCEPSVLTCELSGPSENEQHYPFQDNKNEELFLKYLRQACKDDKLITAGRLGVFLYTNMDTSIAMAIEMISFIEEYKKLNSQERYDFYIKLREKYR